MKRTSGPGVGCTASRSNSKSKSSFKSSRPHPRWRLCFGRGHWDHWGAGREVRDKIYKRLSTSWLREREREKRSKRNRRGHFLIYKQNVCRVAQVFMKHFKAADTAAPTPLLLLQLLSALFFQPVDTGVVWGLGAKGRQAGKQQQQQLQQQ